MKAAFIPSAAPPGRLYELDWLRTFAIVLVVAYHVGMFFNSWSYHLKSSEPVREIEPLMRWMHSWRMPLLLFVSGTGAFMMLRNRSAGAFAKDRAKRLLIPLVFGMFVIVPPQIYVEKLSQYPSFSAFYLTVFELQPYPEGNFSWHHLWFILYLFLYGMLGLPFMLYFSGNKADGFKQYFGKVLTFRGALGGGILLSLILEVCLRRHWPENTHALFDDWAGFAHYFVFFLVGYISMATPGVWDAIRRDRRVYSAGALVAALVLITGLYQQIPIIRLNGYNISLGTFHLAAAWLTILALIGQAQVYLRKPCKHLARMNEAGYPVYILHQTILLLSAVPLIDSALSWKLRFALLFSVTLVGAFLIHELLIRRFNLLRLLFGLKSLPRP